MHYRIDWCHPVSGDEADQDWRPCAPGFGVDYSSRAAVESEMALLRLDTADGGYDYRVVECETEAAEPLRTVVSRFDAGAGQWFSVEVEIAS